MWSSEHREKFHVSVKKKKKHALSKTHSSWRRKFGYCPAN